MRHVKGVLFLDYVRMLKAHKGVEWSAMLSAEDLAYLDQTIDTTGDNAIVGTAAYMAPEQAASGGAVDRRADVYSLGVILFEMVVGRHPFPSATDSEYVVRHAEDKPPRPSKLRRCPPELDDIILRCLAKRPDDRYSSAAEVTAALRLVNPRAGKSHGAAIALGVLLAGGAAAAAYFVVVPKLAAKSQATTVAQGSNTDVAPTPAPVVAPAPAAKPTESAKPAESSTDSAPTATPSVVAITVTSKPAGATVYRMDETIPLGVTPFTVSVSRSDTPTHMRFELAGFDTKSVEVPLSDDVEIHASLVHEMAKKSTVTPKSTHTTKPAGDKPAGTKPAGVQREGTIDPFAK